jgi:hypothetical protein
MNIYLIIYFLLNILGLGIVLGKHGQQRDEKYNFYTSLITLIISFILLYLGGCFNNI